MPWVKLDDQIMRSPKIRAVSRDAFALHIAGLCYCATALTDGRIPDRDLPLVAAEALAPEASAGELEGVGLWVRTDGGWDIHDYLDYQPSRDAVMEDRRKARERKAKQRNRETTGESHGGSHGVTDAVTHNGSHGGSPGPPVPSRPVQETPSLISGLTRYGIDPNRLVDLLAEHAARDYENDGGKIKNRGAWLATARKRAAAEHAARAAELAPAFDLDTTTLAEVLTGRRDMSYVQRRDPAPVPDQ